MRAFARAKRWERVVTRMRPRARFAWISATRRVRGGGERSEVGAGAPEAGTVERAAESLRTHGFVIIRASSDDESLIPECALRECAEASDAHLNELLARVGERGVDATTDIFRFAEICSRARGGLRYDFTRPESDVVRALATDTGKRAVRAWETVQISCAPWIEPLAAATATTSSP